jgi:hypothetical protein
MTQESLSGPVNPVGVLDLGLGTQLFAHEVRALRCVLKPYGNFDLGVDVVSCLGYYTLLDRSGVIEVHVKL